VRLRDEQMLESRVTSREASGAFGIREDVAFGVVERISTDRTEPPIPHELRIKRGVDHRRRAPLIARACAVCADDVVVVDANRDGLRVGKTMIGRVASSAGVVAMKTKELVEEKQATDFDLCGIE